MPTPNTSARRNNWQWRRTKVIYHSAERAARRMASSTPTHAHVLCHTLYMLIKSPWTPFVLQAASIPFAPRVLHRLQAQTQIHVGMIKNSDSGDCPFNAFMGKGGGVDCLLVWMGRGGGRVKQGRELLQCDEILHAGAQRSPLVAGFLGDASLKDSPLHYGIRHQTPHNQLC